MLQTKKLCCFPRPWVCPSGGTFNLCHRMRHRAQGKSFTKNNACTSNVEFIINPSSISVQHRLQPRPSALRSRAAKSIVDHPSSTINYYQSSAINRRQCYRPNAYPHCRKSAACDQLSSTRIVRNRNDQSSNNQPPTYHPLPTIKKAMINR